MLGRKLLILAGAAALALGVTAGTASAAEKVSLRLNWYLSGLHTPIYLGKERGYFSEEGIDLIIKEGRGSGVATQIIGAKGDTFGLSDASTMILAASKGVPIKAVMSVLNKSPFGIVSLASSGIRTAKDLEGKSLAVSPGDSLTQLFPAVISANNLDKSKIKMMFVDPAGKVVAVLEKKADALLGASSQFFQIENKGKKAALLYFTDIGVSTVGVSVIAHRNTIKKNPDLVKRFVKAMQRSYEAGIADPDATIAAAKRAKPDVKTKTLRDQFRVTREMIESPASKGKGIGYQAAEDWGRTLSLMKKYRGLKTDKVASWYYTNEFLK